MGEYHEKNLIEQWLSLPRPFKATLSDGREIIIFSSGIPNPYDGPDLMGCIIQTNEHWLTGNIEVHIRASDWYRHKHHQNPFYDNILFQIVLYDDKPCFNSKGQIIPSLLIPIHLNSDRSFLNTYMPTAQLLENLFLSRLEQRKNYFLNLWKLHKWNVRISLWHHILIGIGKPYFTDVFEWLGFELPWHHLFSFTCPAHIEYLLNNSLATCPFPIKRKTLPLSTLEKKLGFFIKLFYNKRHYVPHQILSEHVFFFAKSTGYVSSRSQIFFVNGLLPALCVLFPEKEKELTGLLKKFPAEKNAIISTFAKEYQYHPQNMIESQAILELVKQKHNMPFSLLKSISHESKS